MSYQLAVEAGEKLAGLGYKQLEEAEGTYGSADEYVEKTALRKMARYAAQRIAVYLNNVGSEKGDPDILLGHCVNHLRFVLAKVDALKTADRQGVSYP